MAGRNSALRGHEIVLTAIFLDAGGDYTDPNPLSSLKLSIFPPGHDPRLGAQPAEAWVVDASLTSEGSGPYADPLQKIEKIDTGQYKYTFLIPSDSDFGSAFDNWRGIVDSQDLDETFTFVVVGGGSVETTQLFKNNAVLIELKNSIAATDGATLGQDYRWHFTTTYDPLYTSVRRVRLDLGPLIKDVADDTINLAIFEASLEADALVFGTLSPDNWKYFYFARRMYVTCLAEMILLGSIMGSGGGAKSKRLADLDVDYDDNVDDLMNRALGCMAKYEAVLTSAGQLAPGTSQQPDYGVKGADDPDRPVVGRGWEPTSTYAGAEIQMPAANTKSRYSWKRRSQRDFAWPSRWRAIWRK
jgi:hypothetical protein